MNVNATHTTTGATALLLPAQNTHTLQDPKRDGVWEKSMKKEREVNTSDAEVKKEACHEACALSS